MAEDWQRQTLLHCLDRSARVGRPEVDGLRYLDRQENPTFLSWATLRDRALRAAGTLAGSGVRPGDRVAVILPTSPLFTDAFFGVLAAGAVPVPLYPPVRLGRLDEYFGRTAAMLRAVDAVAIVADRQVRRVLGQVVARYRPRFGVIAAETLARGPEHPATLPHPDDLAMVQFSSGTTVSPKPVGLTHRQVLANAERILDFMPEDAPYEQAGVSWLPLYHDMGLIGCIFVALHRPGPLTLIPPEAFLARPAIWLRTISRYRATVSPAPDFAWSLCVERIRDEELEDCDLSSWRLGLNGAEPISPRTIRTFTERFARWGLRREVITPVYGLSEASLAVTFSDPTRPAPSLHLDREALSRGEARPGQPAQGRIELVSVGHPLRDFAVEVRDPGTGAPLPEGRVGRVFVAGPSLMQGYLDRQEQPIEAGWLDTGDLGFLWQGALTITGRARDLLILRGRNHAPQDVERAVDAVPGVRTGCSAAVAELGEDGERLLLFVEARQMRPELAEDCRKAVKGLTGLDPALVLVLEPGTLPRTSSGKIRRGETLRLWQAGRLSPPEKITPWLVAGTLARSVLGYLRPGREAGGEG